MTMRPAMSPTRTRTFLLVLTFVGIFYYYSGKSPLPSRLQDFVTVPDPFHGDAGPISTDLTTYTGEVLLVSAFFPLNHTRHPDQVYERWIGNFLRTVRTPIYFFTPPGIEPLVRKQRGSLPITINSSYADPFDVPPVEGLYEDYYKMHRQNKDRRAEEPGLYALRTTKPWFLTEAVKNYERGLPPGSKSIGYAFWVDIGSFQDGLKVHDWPNVGRVKEVFREGAEATRRSEDELVFFPMNDVPNLTMQWWKEDMGPFYTIFAQGTSFLVPGPGFRQTDERWFFAQHPSLAEHRRRSSGGSRCTWSTTTTGSSKWGRSLDRTERCSTPCRYFSPDESLPCGQATSTRRMHWKTKLIPWGYVETCTFRFPATIAQLPHSFIQTSDNSDFDV